MKKLLSLLSILTISGTSIPSVTAVNPYQQPKTKNLNDLIKKVDLGNIIDNYEDTILHAITRLNPRVRMNEIRISQLYNRRARIIFADAPNSFNINDSVVVSFNISSEGMAGNSRFYNYNNPRLEPHRPAPPIPSTEIKPTKTLITPEPIYATVLPKQQRNNQNNVMLPKPSPRNLNNLSLNTFLGELPDNLAATILNRFQELNSNLNINQISVTNITNISATIVPHENSRYIGNLQVTFTLNAKDNQNNNKRNENKPDNDSNANDNHKIKDIITKFNNISKQNKQDKLNEINKHYQTLSENGKKDFNNKLKNIGLGLTSAGISGVGVLGISQMTGISPIKATMNSINTMIRSNKYYYRFNNTN